MCPFFMYPTRSARLRRRALGGGASRNHKGRFAIAKQIGYRYEARTRAGGELCFRLKRSVFRWLAPSRSSRNSMIASKDMPKCQRERSRSTISGNHTLGQSPAAISEPL